MVKAFLIAISSVLLSVVLCASYPSQPGPYIGFGWPHPKLALYEGVANDDSKAVWTANAESIRDRINDKAEFYLNGSYKHIISKATNGCFKRDGVGPETWTAYLLPVSRLPDDISQEQALTFFGNLKASRTFYNSVSGATETVTFKYGLVSNLQELMSASSWEFCN